MVAKLMLFLGNRGWWIWCWCHSFNWKLGSSSFCPCAVQIWPK